MTPEARFWAKVHKTPDCWVWKAFIAPNGYGRFWLNGRNENAHRALYLLDGPIPPGLVLDHICQNKACVKPAHLQLVTPRENVLRWAITIDQCPRGHPYTPENTKLGATAYGGVSRTCRICHRAAQGAYLRSLQSKSV